MSDGTDVRPAMEAACTTELAGPCGGTARDDGSARDIRCLQVSSGTCACM